MAVLPQPLVTLDRRRRIALVVLGCALSIILSLLIGTLADLLIIAMLTVATWLWITAPNGASAVQPCADCARRAEQEWEDLFA